MEKEGSDKKVKMPHNEDAGPDETNPPSNDAATDADSDWIEIHDDPESGETTDQSEGAAAQAAAPTTAAAPKAADTKAVAKNSDAQKAAAPEAAAPKAATKAAEVLQKSSKAAKKDKVGTEHQPANVKNSALAATVDDVQGKENAGEGIIRSPAPVAAGHAEGKEDVKSRRTDASDLQDLLSALMRLNVTRVNASANQGRIHHSTYQPERGRIGPGWMEGGKLYRAAGTDIVYDTRRPPPGDCFNCVRRGEPANHWRKNCPYGVR